MGRHHVVQPGDCIESISLEHGFFPDTLWDHPANESLRTERPNPHVLSHGDRVFIPDLRAREEACATGRRHVFRRRGVPARFRVVFTKDGEPEVGVAYRLTVGASTDEGTTDAEGAVEHWIPPNATEAVLALGEMRVYHFSLGHLPRHDSSAGVLSRLKNLGYLPRSVVSSADIDELPEAAVEAIQRFRRDHGLASGASIDAELQDALRDEHKS
jgi:hypothetical protein